MRCPAPTRRKAPHRAWDGRGRASSAIEGRDAWPEARWPGGREGSMPRKSSRTEGYVSPNQNNLAVAFRPRSRKQGNFLRPLEAGRLQVVEENSRVHRGPLIIE